MDVKTGWIEGINEYGISLVNSVLPIAKEENMTDDGKYSGKSDGKFDGKYQGKITNKPGYKKAIVTLKKGQSIDLTTGI